MSGIIIAGTHSGCGKTTVTLGIMAALKKKGLTVQPFKAGPDFIDAGLHSLITGSPSRNLDLWMCGEEYVKKCFYRYSLGSEISIIEGVMGLYDGEFSTSRLAKVLDLPIILVVDAYGMAESAGAIVKGFSSYDDLSIAGVIFNRVASKSHYERIRRGISNVTVLGYIPKDISFKIPHRHLGLFVAEEKPITKENIERLTSAVLEHIDINEIERISGAKGAIKNKNNTQLTPYPHNTILNDLRIAIAFDKAFCFYYEDNLDLLREAGAEIIRFSPLSDNTIPEADLIYVGGGYPELYAKRLSENISMLKAIYEWAESGRPIYAECGGLMYLSQGIYDLEGNFFKMVGIFPFVTGMKKERPYLGYREIELKKECLLGKSAERLRGHEFHYSEIIKSSNSSSLSMVYSLKNNKGEFLKVEGYRFKNVLASYVHIHFGSNPATTGNLINFIKEEHGKDNTYRARKP